MNRLDIYYAIRKRGQSLAGISRELAVSKSVVTDVIARRRKSRRVAEHIAQLIGKPLSRVFPAGDYAAAGERNSSTNEDEAA